MEYISHAVVPASITSFYKGKDSKYTLLNINRFSKIQITVPEFCVAFHWETHLVYVVLLVQEKSYYTYFNPPSGNPVIEFALSSVYTHFI